MPSLLSLLCADLPKPQRAVFIVGCGHTGTSLLVRMLAQNPEVFAPAFETNAFADPYGLSPRHGARLLQRIRHLLKSYVESGRAMLVEKTPKHIHSLGFIQKLIPGAVFLLAVRDGRDVVASLRERSGDFDAAVDRWVTDTAAVVAALPKTNTILWRYEDLIAAPEARLGWLCEQLRLPFSPDMLAFHADERLFNTDEDTHGARRNAQLRRPLFDGRGRWKRDLSDSELAVFGAGEGLRLQAALGY